MKPRHLTVIVAVIMVVFMGLAFAATPDNIRTSMCGLYNTVRGALAVGMLLLVVLAAIVYAVGQVMGAETRARASVWATAMFVGAIVGALIYIIVPFVISYLTPDLFGGTGGETDLDTICLTLNVPVGGGGALPLGCNAATCRPPRSCNSQGQCVFPLQPIPGRT